MANNKHPGSSTTCGQKEIPKGLSLRQKLFRLKKVNSDSDSLNQDDNQFKVDNEHIGLLD